MRGLRQKKRARSVRTFISEASRSTEIGRLAALADAMFRRFNGPEQFASVWAEVFQIAMDRRSPLAMRSALALLNMQSAIEANQPRLDLGEEALQARLSAALLELVAEHPQIVLAAASDLGWAVSPPALQQA